jgi:hypothetical protein
LFLDSGVTEEEQEMKGIKPKEKRKVRRKKKKKKPI